MTDADLIPEATFKDLIHQKFEKIECESSEEEDPYTAGNYDVIKQLTATCPEAAEAKTKIDIIIDKCGPSPKGIGIQNLRECIIQTKVTLFLNDLNMTSSYLKFSGNMMWPPRISSWLTRR